MLYISVFYLLSFILNFKVKMKDNIYLIFHVIVTTILFLRYENAYLSIFLMFIYFVYRYRVSSIVYIVVYYIIFFSYISFIELINPYMIYRGFLLHISVSNTFVCYFVPVLNIFAIRYINILLKKMIKRMKYTYNVIVKIDDRVRRYKGYYDSGNTLTYNYRPVIFLRGINSNKKIEFECANNSSSSSYVKGEVYVNKKYFSVYIASSNRSFNGCDVLLNALTI